MAAELVVMGLGHVGLPLSRAAVSAGLATAGYDVSRPVVDGLAEGRSHVGGVDDADVAAMLRAGFHATDDPAVLEGAQTVVICVPTGLTDKGLPDLSAVEDATAAVAARLHPGTLVVLESTSYPGTTEDVVRPLLERGSGLRAGEDFHLAYSPQRIDPGNPTWDVRNTPKIVSGRTALCAKHAVAFYSRFVDQLVVARGTREAEMAKLLENTYRYVNIALVDEVALFCHETGIDIWDVLHCAASKPFGFAPFSPGPGVGGHCIPVDPRYLAARAESQGFAFRTLAAAQDVLSRMPDHVVDRALTILTETAGRPEGREPCCSASPTSPMWRTSARHRHARWPRDCSPPASRCRTTTPTSPSSPSAAHRCPAPRTCGTPWTGWTWPSCSRTTPVTRERRWARPAAPCWTPAARPWAAESPFSDLTSHPRRLRPAPLRPVPDRPPEPAHRHRRAWTRPCPGCRSSVPP